MAKSTIDSSLLDKAIIFAVKAHKNIERRGKGFPYIVHPMEAMEIVATITSDQHLLAAAALHDVVEDTDYTADDIRREFGDRIADLVISESDVYLEGENSENSWHRRKEEAINRIRESSLDSKIVAMGDKLSNMRAIARDYAVKGDELWNLFHEKRRSEHEWHYRGLAMALRELSETAAYKEFEHLVESVFAEKVETISMDDYEESGEGYTAVSYNHKQGDTMIKMYKPFMPSSVPMKELRTARVLYEIGLKTPKAIRMVTDGIRFGAEFQRIYPKASFSRVIADNPGKLTETAVKFAKMCRELHSLQCNTSFFPSQIDVARNYIKESKLFSDEEKKPMYEYVNRLKSVTTCLHGDMHIGNVITKADECWWIDLGDFSYGDPRFDLGLFYLLVHHIDRGVNEAIFHISLEQLQQVWNVFIREYLGTTEEEKVEQYEKSLIPFAAITMMRFSNNDGKISDNLRKFIIDNLR